MRPALCSLVGRFCSYERRQQARSDASPAAHSGRNRSVGHPHLVGILLMAEKREFLAACKEFCSAVSEGDGYSPAEIAGCFSVIATVLFEGRTDRELIAHVFDTARDVTIHSLFVLPGKVLH